MDSIIPGICIGVLAGTRLITRGQILGISGYLRKTLHRTWQDSSKPAFILGMAGAGIVTVLLSGTSDRLPSSYSLLRGAGAGVCVGLGTAIGGGCTSGHGVCGCARLSKRSLIFTSIMMAVGIASSKAFKTSEVLKTAGLGGSEAPLQHSLGLLAACAIHSLLFAFAGKRMAGYKKSVWDAVLLAMDLSQGTLFALALVLSGMTQPSKVAGALDLFGSNFDPSLFFVMGGALFAAFPFFRSSFVRRPKGRSLRGAPFPVLPSVVDTRLLAGATLFGAGWGLGGFCPGPAIVTWLYGGQQAIAFMGSMTSTYVIMGKLGA